MTTKPSNVGPLPAPVILGALVLIAAIFGFLAFRMFTQPAPTANATPIPAAAASTAPSAAAPAGSALPREKDPNALGPERADGPR